MVFVVAVDKRERGRHIARLLIDCEAKDGETKKAHLSVSLFDTAYGAAPGVENNNKCMIYKVFIFYG